MIKITVLVIVIIIASSFKTAKLQWVAIGDSITYLNEHPDEGGNRFTKGYMTRVVEKLPSINYINQGHNGWTAGNIAAAIDTLDIIKADIYTIFLGTNDWWSGRPLGTIADYRTNAGNQTVYGSFKIIISKLRSLNKQARIILITPMQRADFVYIGNMNNNAYGSYKPKNGQELSSFAAAVKEIGDYEKLEVVDLYHIKSLAVERLVKYKRLKDPATGLYTNYNYPAYTTIPFNPARDEYPYPPGAIDMTYDGLHPSDKGFDIIAGMLIKLMSKMISPSSTTSTH